MTRHRVVTSTVAAAPPAVVWARLADISTWSTWGQWDETWRAHDGEPDPEGVGALCRYRRGRRVHTEEVVAFEPPVRLAYEVRAGLPVRDYHAEVVLEPVNGGTRIRWEASFDGANPIAGALVHQVLKRFFPVTARQLARAAEADARAAP